MKLYDFQSQIVKDIFNAIKEGHKRILICSPCGSGKSYIIKYMFDRANRKTILFCHRKELKDQHQELMPDVRIELPITAHNLLQKNEIGDEKFTINDEVHLALSRTWNKLMSHYKDEGAFIMGFSATPERLDGKPFGDMFTKLVQGPTVKWLIDNKFLSPFKYYCPQIPNIDSLSTSARTSPEAHLKEYNELFQKNDVFGNVVDTYEKFLNNKKTIIYCINKAHAKEIADAFISRGHNAISIDSDNSKPEREDLMDRFIRGEIKIMCNCGLLSEGISINDLEGVMLCRPTSSYALYVQQSMRPLRIDPNNPKKQAIIVDMVNNYRRHGLPDEEHDYSLGGSKRKKQEFDEEGDFLIRYCKNCFQAFETAKKCPHCNTEYQLEAREIEAHEQIEIAEIKESQRQQKKLNKKNFDAELKNCKSESDAVKLAKEYGYHPYYGVNRWRHRRWIRW